MVIHCLNTSTLVSIAKSCLQSLYTDVWKSCFLFLFSEIPNGLGKWIFQMDCRPWSLGQTCRTSAVFCLLFFSPGEKVVVRLFHFGYSWRPYVDSGSSFIPEPCKVKGTFSKSSWINLLVPIPFQICFWTLINFYFKHKSLRAMKSRRETWVNTY